MRFLEKLASDWNKLSLILRIVIGLVAGSVAGFVFSEANYPELQCLGLLGELYIGLLKAIAPTLVFVLVISAISQSGKARERKGNIKNIIILYMISSFCAAVFAVACSFVYRVTLPGLHPNPALASVETNLWKSISKVLFNVVSNPIAGLANGDYLPILFWACVLGVFLRKASDQTKTAINDVSAAVTGAVQLVISFAPFGVLGLIFTAISTSGLDIFVDYGKLILLLVLAMVFVALVINPIIVALCLRKNPYPLVFKCLKYSGLNAFFTRSSAANIPVNLELCKSLGLSEEDYSVTIPLGATINMAGAAVVITIMTLATVWTMNIPVDFGQALLLCLVGTIAACGTAGTAGGSLMLIPLACAMFGIPADIAWFTVGVGAQIGVIQDSCETAINSSSDVLFTAAAEFRHKRLLKR